jgi:hypothetical protein
MRLTFNTEKFVKKYNFDRDYLVSLLNKEDDMFLVYKNFLFYRKEFYSFYRNIERVPNVYVESYELNNIFQYKKNTLVCIVFRKKGNDTMVSYRHINSLLEPTHAVALYKGKLSEINIDEFNFWFKFYFDQKHKVNEAADWLYMRSQHAPIWTDPSWTDL